MDAKRSEERTECGGEKRIKKWGKPRHYSGRPLLRNRARLPPMRLLALETDAAKITKQFTTEGEEVLLTTTRHVFHCLTAIAGVLIVTVVLVAAGISAVSYGFATIAIVAILLTPWLLFALYRLIDAVIGWRFYFLIVTTEKVVIVRHRFYFRQEISPIHLENIVSTRSDLQFLGVGNCGMLHLTLMEKKQGTSGEVLERYLPKPAVIAGAIENAMVLKKQRAPADKGPEEQERKVEEVKEKVEEEIGKGEAV